ncbi:MAG: GGDEF domain-containing protein [Methylocystis sp.]|nr:MAG: GGDEF domain-containing protein [Methylocystis sp.]
MGSPTQDGRRGFALPGSIAKLTAVFNTFAVIGIVAMAFVTVLSIDAVRIGGAMYERIASSKDLVADIMPPPLFVVEAYQEASNLAYAPFDEGLDRGIVRLRDLHAQYVARHAYWTASTISADVKRKLTVDSDREARRFWSEVDDDFLPALRSGDRAGALASFKRMSDAFRAHRQLVTEIVADANQLAKSVEETAERQQKWFLSVMAGTLVLGLCLAIFALRTMQARVTRPLATLADFMNGRVGDGARVPFLERDDEIGAVANAVDSFGADVEQRVLEAKNAQLDGALNNIVQGVEMYDAAGKLVLCNARYLEIYGHSEEQLVAGLDLDQVVALRVGAGLLTDEAAESIVVKVRRARSEADLRTFQCRLSDDRCISISVQMMRDGRGFVATHQDVSEQRRSEARIAYLAHHDALTGLPNRIRLTEELEKALAYVRRGEVVAVHMIDLDHFKSVNDSLGHQAGDKLLGLVAERLRSELRETDRIGRMGGDEFAIVERMICEPSDAAALAARITRVIGEPFDIDGHRIVIGASVGIAVGPQDGASSEALMHNADLALYRAKADGRGKFHFFEAGMDAQMQARASLERDLRRALAKSEFELHYQPIVNVRTSEICGFEALLRWRHPEKGLIRPDHFIPLAEETRLIVPIGEWVLREACATATGWPKHLNIAVNLSAVQFHHGSVREAVTGAVAATGLDPARLELEITESLLLEGDERTLDTLHHLRAIGAQITMDDFGTGYSSLSYLQSFPFDKIKIDKSFVQRIDGDAKSLKIVRAVATLANGLGIRTTAEGVESVEQLAAIRSEGCTEIQGFLMSKPLTIAEVEQLFRMRPTLDMTSKGEIAA